MTDEIEEGFVLGYHRRLVNVVDPAYDAFGKFPELDDFRNDNPESSVRDAISRALTVYFFQHKHSKRSLDIASTQPVLLPSGDYETSLSFAFAINGGANKQPSDLQNHRFVLRQDGWLFPSLNIIDHDPITWP